MWCSILVRKLIKRASFASVENVEAKVLACIDDFNETMANPVPSEGLVRRGTPIPE